MEKLAEELNENLGAAADFLSPAGLRMYFPKGGILGQGAEAKGCAINATIGMAFEEDGSPLVMDCFAKRIKLGKEAFLYCGSYGLPMLRDRWRELESEKNPSLKGKRFSRPVVTHALTHGLRVAAEMFVAPGDTVVIPDLFWDNYKLVFGEALGARIRYFNTFKDDRFDAAAMKEALLDGGGKKILVLNFPNNPTGYTATERDAREIVAAASEAARAGVKIVALFDDAYFGLVYEEGVHGESLFADFCDLSENILAVKLDGTTKEDYVWGLRVGFITFAFKGATLAQLAALEDKAAGNVRSGISNCSSLGEHLALAALDDHDYAAQKRAKYEILKRRYLAIRDILARHPEYSRTFETMPFNSGYFMCVKPKGVDAEAVRRRLVEKYSTGTIVLSGLIRIAFSATPLDRLETLFENVNSAIAEEQQKGETK